jgi:hypothetical protein
VRANTRTRRARSARGPKVHLAYILKCSSRVRAPRVALCTRTLLPALISRVSRTIVVVVGPAPAPAPRPRWWPVQRALTSVKKHVTWHVPFKTYPYMAYGPRPHNTLAVRRTRTLIIIRHSGKRSVIWFKNLWLVENDVIDLLLIPY